jgi:hypothetical protein
MSIQEAAEVEENPYLDRLFGPDVLGRLPTTGLNLVRKTALGLIGGMPQSAVTLSIDFIIRSVCIMVPTYLDGFATQRAQLRC